MIRFARTSRLKDMYTKLACANNNYAHSGSRKLCLSKVWTIAGPYIFSLQYNKADLIMLVYGGFNYTSCVAASIVVSNHWIQPMEAAILQQTNPR